jgi:hypothetical protein
VVLDHVPRLPRSAAHDRASPCIRIYSGCTRPWLARWRPRALDWILLLTHPRRIFAAVQYLHQPWEHGDHPPDLSDEDDVFLANLKAQTAK